MHRKHIQAMKCTAVLTDCPICAEPVSQCMEKLGFSYSRCSACEYIFVNPRPDPTELSNWYSSHSSFRGHASGESLRSWSEGISQPHERLVLSRIDARGKLLDIGCGYGLNISLFQQYAGRFKCYGIEPDAVAAAECTARTGVSPFVGTFEAFRTDDKLDLIFLNQVIEHVIDPGAWIARIECLLAPGGIVVIGTPNSRGFYSMFLGRQNDPFFHAPLHLNHFTPENLSMLIRRFGMEVIMVHKFSDLRPISFHRHPKQPKWSARLFWQMHRPVAATLDQCGLGLVMHIAAKKKNPAHKTSSPDRR